MKVYDFINYYARKICEKRIFGVPGSFIMPIWDNMKDFEIVLCTNEQDAGYIAGGYSREIEKPVVVLTTASPGVTNAISGMAAAYKDYTPVIFISGVCSADNIGAGVFQEESSVGRNFLSTDLCSCVTKRSFYIDKAENVIPLISKAFCTALEKPCGPVHISIPVSVQTADISVEQAELMFPSNSIHFPDKQIDRTADILLSESLKKSIIQKKMIIIVGSGIGLAGENERLNSLLQKLACPFLCTMKGTYCVDMSSEFFAGVLGMGYTDVLSDFITNYQPGIVVILGSSVDKNDFIDRFWDDIRSSFVYCFYTGNRYMIPGSIQSEAISVDDMSALMDEFIEFSGKTDICSLQEIQPCMDRLRECRKKWILKNLNDGDCEKSFMKNAIYRLNKILSDDQKKYTLVTADAGNHYLDAVHLYRSASINGFWIDVGLAAMGNGICGTIGMAFGGHHKRYISITGDGCMMMNGNSIHVASVKHLPVLFIVFNNQSLGMVRVHQIEKNICVSSEIKRVDYQKYGESMGLISRRALNLEQFSTCVAEFMEQGKTMLLEVITDKDERPIGLK